MLSKEQKKQAAQQFREKKVRAGVYAIRCTTTGSVWVGVSRNLDTARNSNWAALRMRGHRDRPLQDEWAANDEPAFTFEALESLEEDTPALLMPDLLKSAKQRWLERLGARGLL